MNSVINKIGVLAAVLLCSLSAHAGKYGGYIIKTGSLDIHLDLKGVGNPSKKPQINIVSGTLDQVEYACKQVSDNQCHTEQGYGLRYYSGAEVLSSGDVTGQGQGVVNMSFAIPGPFPCLSEGWEYVPKSEVAKSVTMTSKWYACTGNPDTDEDPCFDGTTPTIEKKPNDTMNLVCSSGDVPRNADGTAVPGQVYSCAQVP